MTPKSYDKARVRTRRPAGGRYDFEKMHIMETKIVKTLKEWLPWSTNDMEPLNEYAMLKKLAEYCKEQINEGAEKKATQVIGVINLLYISGSLHDRNAIENEFLEVLSQSESPAGLKSHLKLFPEKLKQAYLKTILEN